MIHPGFLSLLLVTEKKKKELKCSKTRLSQAQAQVQNSRVSVTLNRVFPEFIGRQLQLDRHVYTGQRESV